MRTIELTTAAGNQVKVTIHSYLNQTIDFKGVTYPLHTFRSDMHLIDKIGADLGNNRLGIVILRSDEYGRLQAAIEENVLESMTEEQKTKRAKREATELERKKEERTFDQMYNEGGDGYNPYRPYTYEKKEPAYKGDLEAES